MAVISTANAPKALFPGLGGGSVVSRQRTMPPSELSLSSRISQNTRAGQVEPPHQMAPDPTAGKSLKAAIRHLVGEAHHNCGGPAHHNDGGCAHM